MDPISQNQTSFIPRREPGRESAIREKPVSLFLVISTIIFALAALGAIGVFAYKYYLDKNIKAKEDYLVERRDALEPTTIDYIIKTDKQLKTASDLLNKHIAVTPIFDFLESVTLKTVRFSKFEYLYNQSGSSVKISGEAKSYGSVALQADTLNRETQLVKNAVFSNLDLNDKGEVTFDAVINFDPDINNYKKNLPQE